MKPLLHTWSLAVEEQYYIFFPPVLAALWRFGRRWILIVLGVMALGSFAIALWLVADKPTDAFFLLPARGWELLSGAFVAFYLSKGRAAVFEQRVNEAGAVLGAALILYSIFYFDETTAFPGANALVPTLGAALIIIFATETTRVGKLLSTKIFVGLGLISYSAYLWHQPVLAFGRYGLVELTFLTQIVLVFAILGLAVLSWSLVERPFRDKAKVSRRFIFGGSLGVMGFYIVFGVFSSGLTFNVEETMAQALSEGRVVYASNSDERALIKARVTHEKSDPEALVIGSSRLMQASAAGTGFDLLNLSVSGASLEDFLAIGGLGLAKFNPSYVFVGADPWLFNKNSGQTRWATLGDEYRDALHRLGFAEQIALPAETPDSFFARLAVDLYKAINISAVSAANDSAASTDKIRPDGSRVYNLSYANKPAAEIALGAEDFSRYAMKTYEASGDAARRFMAFLTDLKRQNKTVTLVLSPYHPKLFDYMRAERPVFLEIERQYRDIARAAGVRVIGSYDPKSVGCSAEEFYDGMHPKGACLNKVFSQMSR